jgi:hypothetical protein
MTMSDRSGACLKCPWDSATERWMVVIVLILPMALLRNAMENAGAR